jgi:purine-cytosine permease-like protein
MDAIVTAIMTAAKSPKTGGLALATWGVYGGQYANFFPDPTQILVAGWLCVSGIFIGMLFFIYYQLS